MMKARQCLVCRRIKYMYLNARGCQRERERERERERDITKYSGTTNYRPKKEEFLSRFYR
jgi:hypothetical protein